MKRIMRKILVIDDDRTICSSMSLLLKKRGYLPFTVNYPSEAMDKVKEVEPDLILLDMNFTIETTGKQGLSLLKTIRGEYTKIPIILMTGWATVQLAVEGMKLGAQDFIAKPWDNQHLIQSISDIIVLDKGIVNLEKEDDNFSSDHIIGESPNFIKIMELAKKVAKTNASVLITGESGTGKEVISEAIHEMSLRSQHPFVKVNLGGVSTSLFESEMFGHKKGAFTGAVSDRAGRFEVANKGSIFLDEIGDLSLASQVKLLRVLQEKCYEPLGSSHTKKTDVRIICATNRDLKAMVEKGTFREDLYYRINLITLHLPALRDRKEDIPALVNYFIETTGKAYQINIPRVDESTMKWLMEQDFPGNIRQLKNIVERAILLNIGKEKLTIEAFELKESVNPSALHVSLPAVGKVSLEEMEINMIKKAFKYHDFSISKTANSLGITRSALYRRLEKYKITHEP